MHRLILLLVAAAALVQASCAPGVATPPAAISQPPHPSPMTSAPVAPPVGQTAAEPRAGGRVRSNVKEIPIGGLVAQVDSLLVYGSRNENDPHVLAFTSLRGRITNATSSDLFIDEKQARSALSQIRLVERGSGGRELTLTDNGMLVQRRMPTVFRLKAGQSWDFRLGIEYAPPDAEMAERSWKLDAEYEYRFDSEFLRDRDLLPLSAPPGAVLKAEAKIFGK
jgi:hypothetical protein